MNVLYVFILYMHPERLAWNILIKRSIGKGHVGHFMFYVGQPLIPNTLFQLYGLSQWVL